MFCHETLRNACSVNNLSHLHHHASTAQNHPLIFPGHQPDQSHNNFNNKIDHFPAQSGSRADDTPYLHEDCTPVVNDHPNTPLVHPGGNTFMDQFFNDQYATSWQENPYYPFALGADWQLSSWLLHSGLSMAAIDNFLSSKLVCPFTCLLISWSQLSQIKQLPISFQSVEELCLCAKMLPSSPHWKSHTLQHKLPMKHKAIIYYCNPVDCLQSLLNHPIFTSHISFCQFWWFPPLLMTLLLTMMVYPTYYQVVSAS